MSETTNQPQAQEAQANEAKSTKAKIAISRSRFAAILGLVAIIAGAVAEMKKGPETAPFTVSTSEKLANDDVNQTIMQNGGRMAKNGNAIPKGYTEKPGKIVFVQWPGYKGKTLYYTTKDGKADVIKFDQEKGQIFAINERCLSKMEAFRRCVNRTLHADPLLISGFQSNALNSTRNLQLAIEKGEDIDDDKVYGSPLTTGQCAFELSARDAATGEIPIKKDSNGHAETLVNQDASDKDKREKVKELMYEVAQGQKGLQDIAMECGKEAGFIGGHCGKKGNPYLYLDADDIPEGDPRQNCKRGDEYWAQNYAYLNENPPATSQDSAHDQLSAIGTKLKIDWAKEWAGKVGTKVKEGVKKAQDWCKNNSTCSGIVNGTVNAVKGVFKSIFK